MPTSVLIIDDEAKMAEVLGRMLAREGYEVACVSNPLEGLTLLETRPFDVLLCDLRMPELSGLDVLSRAKRLRPTLDVVLMTAFATPQTAVEAMKMGALDYLIKPFGVDDVKAILKTAEQTRQRRDTDNTPFTPTPLPQDPTPSRATSAPLPGEPGIVFHSRIMSDIVAKARKVAASGASVLIRGESGTGKEVIARLIHAASPRANRPMITVNCGAIPENLIESELFGHVKGAFTGASDTRRGFFEAAHLGTIFLDEVGELPTHLQVRLLRILQDGHLQRVGDSTMQKVDVRVLAATNRNLEAGVADGSFRQDLYYRLNVIPLNLPPLRERREDIEPLIAHFLQRFAVGSKIKRLSEAARAVILQYDYPGNIRELENAIEHATVLSERDEIQVEDLPYRMQEGQTGGGNLAGSSAAAMAAESAGTGHDTLDDVERRLILDALTRTKFNHTRAAAHLGITRRTLGYRITKHGLDSVVEEGMQRAREERRQS